MIRLWCSAFILLLTAATIDTNALTIWPKGSYGLLKPASGCPTGWYGNSWIFQDTEDTNPSNERSKILHMDGFVVPSNVLKYFCIKTYTTGSNWPKGQYCIYRRNRKTLSVEMHWGTIRMYDEDYRSVYKDAYSRFTYGIFGVSSRGKYTDFYFYCRISGNKKIPISLPITKPFYLLPYGSRYCQQVEWMVATSEWIKYHTRNYKGFRLYQTGGKVPYHELGKDQRNTGIKMYYCYYESCNYTLTDKKGVFQSPGFPGKYPDGQLCSWRIMVPDNHTLRVRFTNFSLDENDNLTLIKSYNGSFHINDTIQGHSSKPFTITVTSDVLFVFRTNKEGNSTGFRAEYTISKASETTLSPPSTTRTDHTTTIPTTETKNKTINGTTDNHKSRVGGCSECDGPDTTVFAVLPLIFLIVVMAIAIIILYRWRSKKTECEKCASIRYPNKDAMNPTYDDAGHIQILQRTSTATMNTTVCTDDERQMYQALSGDHDQQPEYEAPDYSKQNGLDDPSHDSGYPEYHELEPMDNNVPDVVYDVLEGPDPSGEQMYHALDKETTHNPLYQSTDPAALVTRNPMYVDSVA